MSQLPPITRHPLNKIGPGRLILVVGPSGAGKDTLIGLAKRACAENGGVVFPRRVVTRAPSAFEDNEYLTPDAFHAARVLGEFAMHWEAHGNWYGLRRSIANDIRAGLTVVVNASRTMIDASLATYANVTVLAVTASPEVLAERLAQRNRVTDGEIAGRLHRSADEPFFSHHTIVNVGPADQVAQRLIDLVRDGEHTRN
jgi:ribose 1,5-bisphosphokinase